LSISFTIDRHGLPWRDVRRIAPTLADTAPDELRYVVWVLFEMFNATCGRCGI